MAYSGTSLGLNPYTNGNGANQNSGNFGYSVGTGGTDWMYGDPELQAEKASNGLFTLAQGSADPESEADPTSYYTSDGQAVGEIKDGSKDVVVFNEQTSAFAAAVLQNSKYLEKLGVSTQELQSFLAGMGITYDIAAFDKFYNNHGSQKADFLDGSALDGSFDFKFNGKPFVPFSEAIGNLVLRGGKVTMGANYSISGDMRSSNVSSIKKEMGTVSDIHTHQIGLAGGQMTSMKMFGLGAITGHGGYFTGGVAPQDRNTIPSNTLYWRVVVDPQRIYLYQRDSRTITIMR